MTSTDRPRQWGTTLPQRTRGLRPVGFTPTVYTGGGETVPGPARAPLKAVSKNRARQNRQRAAMADRLWPGRRDGTVLCAVPDCGRPADDLHEPLTRARGGSIVDPDNSVPLCRPHHDDVTFRPESELRWAYACGILRHSYNDPEGAA